MLGSFSVISNNDSDFLMDFGHIQLFCTWSTCYKQNFVILQKSLGHFCWELEFLKRHRQISTAKGVTSSCKNQLKNNSANHLELIMFSSYQFFEVLNYRKNLESIKKVMSNRLWVMTARLRSHFLEPKLTMVACCGGPDIGEVCS